MLQENKTNYTDYSISDDNFNRIKELFKNDINSNRRFEQITNIDELIDVLEAREVLSEDVLLKLDPIFGQIVKTKRKKSFLCAFKNLELPADVITYISQNYGSKWKEFGSCLKLTQDQLERCDSIDKTLLCFLDNCKGVSGQEVVFRLTRALEKCGREDLKSKVLEMVAQTS